jgi:hypothetical protein
VDRCLGRDPGAAQVLDCVLVQGILTADAVEKRMPRKGKDLKAEREVGLAVSSRV